MVMVMFCVSVVILRISWNSRSIPEIRENSFVGYLFVKMTVVIWWHTGKIIRSVVRCKHLWINMTING